MPFAAGRVEAPGAEPAAGPAEVLSAGVLAAACEAVTADPATRRAVEYAVNGKMIGGFAFPACPASYGSPGVNRFIVSHEGVVCKKDLGKNTSQGAASVMLFNPDKTWEKMESFSTGADRHAPCDSPV